MLKNAQDQEPHTQSEKFRVEHRHLSQWNVTPRTHRAEESEIRLPPDPRVSMEVCCIFRWMIRPPARRTVSSEAVTRAVSLWYPCALWRFVFFLVRNEQMFV